MREHGGKRISGTVGLKNMKQFFIHENKLVNLWGLFSGFTS